MPGSRARPSISGSSVVPGLPNITETPSCRRIVRNADLPEMYVIGANHKASVAFAPCVFSRVTDFELALTSAPDGRAAAHNAPGGAIMTRYLSSLGFLLFAACAGAVSAQTLDDLKNDGKNTDNVLTYGMGYHLNRYSALNQINKTTVKRLVPVWNLSLDNRWGEQAQPLVYNGVMYVTSARWTVAIDVASGKQLWRTEVDWLPETPRVVCCGVSNKGPALYNGKVFRTTLDAFVVALDQKTGKQLWKSKAADWTEGYSMTIAPLVANGVLLTGISRAEFGIPGFIDGWDPA